MCSGEQHIWKMDKDKLIWKQYLTSRKCYEVQQGSSMTENVQSQVQNLKEPKDYKLIKVVIL